MDLHNNAVGRDVYLSLTTKKAKKADYGSACTIIKSKADVAVFVDMNQALATVKAQIASVSSTTLVYIKEAEY